MQTPTRAAKHEGHNATMRLPMLLLLLLLLAAGPAAAAGPDPFLRPGETRPNMRFAEDEPWREQQVTLPAYPDDGDLLEIKGIPGRSGLTVYLDGRSLSLDGDGVSRYTVVVVSRSGVRNVIYEGLRCRAGDYRNYAFGTPQNSFERREDAAWRTIETSGTFAYRGLLRNEYLCDPHRIALEPQQALRRIRYPDNSRLIVE
ncbi:MAG TPA: CNP1-like family protein [Gammaproteobacteria bacterium]